MTWNKDRKQTKYGHKRQEQMTHTTEPWHNSPLPEGVSHAVTVPPGRGGGRALWRPLRTNTDRNTGRGPPERNRQRRPWRSWELWRPWRSWELWRPWRCRELWRPWRMVFGGLGLGPLGPARPLQPEPLLPPQKISLGKSGGIRSPPGLDTQNSTWQDSRARQTGQDIPQEPEALLGWLGSWGFLWAWHDIRGPHRVPQQPLPPPRQGGRRLKWPPWPQQEEPPAPDESPWTRQGSLKCSCGHNKTDTRHSWPWHVDLIHGARDSGGRRAWVSANPAGLSQRRSWVSSDPAGIESEAGRRALSQRRAGGVISRDRRAWGLAASGLAAFPPNSHADLQWAKAGWRAATSLPRDKQTKLRNK